MPLTRRMSIDASARAGSVRSVTFSPDGARVATASEDCTARILALSGDAAPVVLKGHEHSVFDVEFSPSGSLLATASIDGTVRVRGSDGSVRRTIRGHDDLTTSVRFSPDGTRLVTTGTDNTVRTWTTDAPLRVFPGPARVPPEDGWRARVLGRSVQSRRPAVVRRELQHGQALVRRRYTRPRVRP